MAAAVGSVGLGASLAGGLLSAFGASQEGKSQQQMYNYQAQVAKINKDIDLQNRDWAYHKGDVESLQYGLKAGQQFGQIRASQGASGLDVNSGSARDVQESQRKVTQIDQAQLRENAAKTAYDYTVRATMDENQARLYATAGEEAKRAGKLKALSSIIGSAGSVSSKWLQGNQMGMWSTA